MSSRPGTRHEAERRVVHVSRPCAAYSFFMAKGYAERVRYALLSDATASDNCSMRS